MHLAYTPYWILIGLIEIEPKTTNGSLCAVVLVALSLVSRYIGPSSCAPCAIVVRCERTLAFFPFEV